MGVVADVWDNRELCSSIREKDKDCLGGDNPSPSRERFDATPRYNVPRRNFICSMLNEEMRGLCTSSISAKVCSAAMPSALST